jgi:hypothetical protein
MKRLTTGVVAVLLSFAAAGCGDDSGDATAWAEQVCSAVKEDVAKITDTPEIDQSSPQAAKDGYVTYLGTLESTLDGMSSAVEEAGTPPVDGGAEAVKGFTDQISAAKDAVTSAKGKIEAAPVDDPTAFQTAVAGATQDLAALSDMADPMESISSNEALKTAYNEAASCKELEAA